MPSRGLLSEAMPSVLKALAEGPPSVLHEVDRLKENPENGGQRRQWRVVQVTYSMTVCLGLEMSTIKSAIRTLC